MGQFKAVHQPCPCGNSSDAYSVAEDGHGWCFSCGKYFPGDKKEIDLTEFTYEYMARRGITRETHEFFNVKTQIDSTGKPVSVAYVYPDGATQLRFLEQKGFRWQGSPKPGGFAVDRFTPGSSKAITITEGADDAMSAYQMLGRYPVYSVKSASTGLSDVRADYDYLSSFEKIYLALDNDGPGAKCAAEIAACFDFNRVYHVKFGPYKDPTAFLEAGKAQEFRNAWYNAGRFLPEGIVSGFKEIRALLENAKNEPGHPWPFRTLNAMTDGMKRGRAYLVTGLEGIGKTEFFHAAEYHLIKTDPDANMAFIHLEEPVDENVKKLAGYELGVPTIFEDSPVSTDQIMDTYEKIVGREDRVHIYNHFGSDDPDILLSKIRFFAAACKCKYIFLDNITITATGRQQEDERKELDYLSTQLEMMVKALKFVLVAISHENDNGQTRGSRNISKVFDVWINMTRDVKNENPVLRNIQQLTLVKGRGCRGTGPAGQLYYDAATGKLSELEAGDVPA